jgi:hypothetical protein
LSSVSTAAGGYVREQAWTGLFGHEYSVALPDLVASSWPGVTTTKVPREISVGCVLIGTSMADFHDLLDEMIDLCDDTSPVTLTRRRDVGGSTPVEDATVEAVFLGGLDPTKEAPNIGRVVPRWHMLSADWTVT